MELDKKELIRKCAAQAIAKEGYHNTTVKMIAEKADIAVGTIYIYFKTKEEILDYIFLVEHNKRIKYLDELKNNNKGIVQVIQSFLDFHFRELKENPSIGKVLVQEDISPFMSNAEGIKKYQTKLPDILAKMLETAQQDGEIRNIDSSIVSRLIFCLIKGSVGIMQESDTADWINRVNKQIISLILDGIKK